MYFYLISPVAARGGLLLGYDTSVIASAFLFIRNVMSFSPILQGIVVGIALGSAAVGATMVGVFPIACAAAASSWAPAWCSLLERLPVLSLSC